MSLILTPPPTVMVFFKEISLKNESTVGKNANYFILDVVLHSSPCVVTSKSA